LTVSSDEVITVQSITGTAVSVPVIPAGEVSSFNVAVNGASGPGKTITFNYSDSAGNTGSASQTLNVYDRDAYVSAGSTGNGTKTAPYGKIQDAINSFNPGKYEYCAVHVAAGMYTETNNPVVKIDGLNNIFLIGGYTGVNYDQNARSNSLTELVVRGYGYEVAPEAVTPPLSSILFINSNDCIIDGFKLSGVSDTDEYNTYYSAISCFTSAPMIINNNITGIFIDAATCTSAKYIYGIYCRSSTPYIKNNIIVGLNPDSTQSALKIYGLYFMDVNYSDQTISIINNSISGGGYSSLNAQTTGIYFYNNSLSTSLIIRNNTINAGLSSWTGGNRGIDLWINNNADLNLNIENNIIFILSGNTTLGIDLNSNNADYNASIRNNNIFGFTTLNERIGADGTIKDGTVYTEDISDHFVNVTANNYRLTDQSPANLIPSSIKSGGIDGAINSWGYTEDADGNPRTGNGTTGWTLGAFEAD